MLEKTPDVSVAEVAREGRTEADAEAARRHRGLQSDQEFKSAIREWLEARTGLTKAFVYPTAWHQPRLDQFATSHGRRAEL